MPLTESRYKLIIPSSPILKGARLLKSCVRCRQHKTKCDALITNPNPCLQCAKRQINCRLDIITKSMGVSGYTNETIEKLTQDVRDLKDVLNDLLEKKTKMVELLVQRSQALIGGSTFQQTTSNQITPPILQIQSCVNSPEEVREVEWPLVMSSAFTLEAARGMPAFSLSVEEAYEHFTNYEVNFNHFLPIFPDDFFSTINLVKFHEENELLFWSIIITSLLSYPDENASNNYRALCEHVKALVVENCWFKTPRLIYILSALLVLTTWPLPSQDSKIADNLSVKYLLVMKNLLLQFGLHKPEFVNEFSHKTKIDITSEVNLDIAIRERIYKFIHINSNHWMIYLGLATNGDQASHDYILNRKQKEELMQDVYINLLLRVSMIQLKMNENFHSLLDDSNEAILHLPHQVATTKDVNVHMYEIILDDLKKALAQKQQDNEVATNLIDISIQLSRIQLYLHSLTQLDVGLSEYKIYVQKMIISCFRFIDLFQKQFSDLRSFSQLPMHFKFPITQVALVLLRLYKSPLLNTVQDYELVKAKFLAFYKDVVLKGYSADWRFMNARFFKIVEKFDSLSNLFVLEKAQNGSKIVSRMNKHLILSLQYEMIWMVYENEHWEEGDDEDETYRELDWENFGFDLQKDKDVIEYVVQSKSIFT